MVHQIQRASLPIWILIFCGRSARSPAPQCMDNKAIPSFNAADAQHIASYLQHLQTQRKLSEHTLDSYQRDLEQLGALCVEKKISSLSEITAFDTRRFAAQLHSRGLSPSSIARKLSAWRGFFSWMAIHHQLTVNPADGVKAPKRARARGSRSRRRRRRRKRPSSARRRLRRRPCRRRSSPPRLPPPPRRHET